MTIVCAAQTLAQTTESGHVPDAIRARTVFFDLADVRLLDSPFKHASELNAGWMLELDLDRLLSKFRTNAGLAPKAPPYGSWESLGVAGHTLGHLLTAASQQYAATGDERFRIIVDYAVSELDSCQTFFVNGFIGGMPGGDKVFKEVKKGIIRSRGFDLNGLWVPWYNEHKTMTGLGDAYRLTGNRTALKVLVNLADYLADVISPLSEEQMQTMLDCEYGGMNEAFAQVYAFTGEKKYLDASFKFYQKKLQDKLAEGIDALQGLHANTQIPKLIGSARQYELTGNEREHRIAEFAWHTIVHHHSYANGGNSMAEYLTVPDRLNDRLGINTCETCNTYNMLKLTQHLYEWTADPQYLDYYERALYNHILASQHPVEGRVCYFLSLGMGTLKQFVSKQYFSCCTASGFENHSKYGGAIYSRSPENDTLNINLYIPSVLEWKAQDLTLKMETGYPENSKVRVVIDKCPSKKSFALNIRIPAWATAGASVKVNGSKWSKTAAAGTFLTVERVWKQGDRLDLDFPMSLYTVAMPDNPDRRAVFYGPSLLAGVFGSEKRKQGDVPVFVSEEKSITAYMRPVPNGPLQFITFEPGGPDKVSIMPFYKVYDQYQTVYWDVYSPAEWSRAEAARKAEVERIEALNKRTLDYIELGEMQSERDHNLDGEDTRTGEGYLQKYRMAYENGWFAFDMKCGYGGATQLILIYYGEDGKKYDFDLAIGDWTHRVSLKVTQNGFVEYPVDLPADLSADKPSLRIRFQADGTMRLLNIYNVRLVKKN
ncbi:MAG: glycoside hydrolase family 127 protein [Tannerella sp.]|nr:glycoside hydrolase family 127 protein [Tannerella sp.]